MLWGEKTNKPRASSEREEFTAPTKSDVISCCVTRKDVLIFVLSVFLEPGETGNRKVQRRRYRPEGCMKS